MKEEVVLRWLKKAENDLKTVKYLLTLEDAPTDVISFHCQQAVEKYFKAYLTLVDVRVKKIHDLETILALCTEKDKKFEMKNILNSVLMRRGSFMKQQKR